MMLGWTLGGYPSPNLEALSACREAMLNSDVGRPEDLMVETALEILARRRAGESEWRELRKVWGEISRAFSEFPYHIGVVYSGPQQLGPANLLYEKNTGYRATMVGFPYDDLDSWRSIYPAEAFIRQFETIADGFRSAIDKLRRLPARKMSAGQRDALTSELRVGEACELHFRSVANQARFVRTRRALSSAKNATDAASQIADLESLLRTEAELAERLHTLQCADSRIGFEASNQYYYVPADLAEKVLNCDDLLRRWLPAERAKWKL
jgi:hypothetical protein